jgi:hypothetical protein
MRSIVAITVLAVAAVARAQQPAPSPDGECTTTTTTTTTVRCTGAAAPYALPPVVAPRVAAPAAPVYAPAPPVYAPPLAAPIVIDIGSVERGGWKLVQDPDGTLWRERRRHTVSRGLLGAGLGLLLTAYGAAIIGGAATGHEGMGAIPIGGAFINAATSGSQGPAAGWCINGFVQIGGLIMSLLSGGVGPLRVERERLQIAPVGLPGGAGVGMAGRF